MAMNQYLLVAFFSGLFTSILTQLNFDVNRKGILLVLTQIIQIIHFRLEFSLQKSHPAMGASHDDLEFPRYWSFGVQTTRTYLCLGYWQKSRRGMVLSKSFLWLKQ